MKQLILITGGCRSGKSRHALRLAETLAGMERIFVATCQPADDEMRQRVARHRLERSPDWITREVPLRLAQTIAETSNPETLLLVDCLTLWISNLLAQNESLAHVENRVGQLAQVLSQARGPIFLVSNEVGAGIVPENRLARIFRDAVGFANQTAAGLADRVFWMVAGLAVQIK